MYECEGLVKIIACIEDPVVTETVLIHLKAKVGSQEQPSKFPPTRVTSFFTGMGSGIDRVTIKNIRVDATKGIAGSVRVQERTMGNFKCRAVGFRRFRTGGNAQRPALGISRCNFWMNNRERSFIFYGMI